jgi:hypothetical protein
MQSSCTQTAQLGSLVEEEGIVREPSQSYIEELLDEMRDAAVAAYDLEIKRIDWMHSKAATAFAVLGVGLALLVSRLDILCNASDAAPPVPFRWWVLVVAGAGALLWLVAFGMVTYAVAAPWRSKRVGPPEQRALWDQLYYSDDVRVLRASVAEAYDKSADLNRVLTDEKAKTLRLSFALLFAGLVAVFLAALLTWVTAGLKTQAKAPTGARAAARQTAVRSRRPPEVAPGEEPRRSRGKDSDLSACPVPGRDDKDAKSGLDEPPASPEDKGDRR